MKKKVDLREASRVDWHSVVEVADDHKGTPYPGDENIKIGCMQRIAAATEAMAKSHTDLQADRDRYKQWYHEEIATNEDLRKEISSLRGLVTRYKNIIKKLNDANNAGRAADSAAGEV